MLGAVLSVAGALFGAAATMDGNDKDREIAQRESEKEIALERERTKQAVINGIFDVLSSHNTNAK